MVYNPLNHARRVGPPPGPKYPIHRGRPALTSPEGNCDAITNSGATVQIDGARVSSGAITLDFASVDFVIVELPEDDVDITINAERIEDIAGAMVSGNADTLTNVTYE